MLFYSVFQTFHRKKPLKKHDSSVVLKRFNPEGPFKRYLCEVTLHALLISVSFFSVDKNVNKGLFTPGEKKNYTFFLSPVKSINPYFHYGPLIPSTHDVIILCKLFFYFMLLLIALYMS